MNYVDRLTEDRLEAAQAVEDIRRELFRASREGFKEFHDLNDPIYTEQGEIY